MLRRIKANPLPHRLANPLKVQSATKCCVPNPLALGAATLYNDILVHCAPDNAENWFLFTEATYQVSLVLPEALLALSRAMESSIYASTLGVCAEMVDVYQKYLDRVNVELFDALLFTLDVEFERDMLQKRIATYNAAIAFANRMVEALVFCTKPGSWCVDDVMDTMTLVKMVLRASLRMRHLDAWIKSREHMSYSAQEYMAEVEEAGSALYSPLTWMELTIYAEGLKPKAVL